MPSTAVGVVPLPTFCRMVRSFATVGNAPGILEVALSLVVRTERVSGATPTTLPRPGSAAGCWRSGPAVNLARRECFLAPPGTSSAKLPIGGGSADFGDRQPRWPARCVPSGLRMGEAIDVTFDFRSDTPPGRDPDAYSPTLRRYHQLLWSKRLPSGAPFELDAKTVPFLHHLSELGEFWLTSDSVIPTFSRAREMGEIIGHIPQEETGEFNRIAYTIGGMMIFPGNRVGGKATINGARGFHPKIRDRFDLTLECIRRHYVGEQSPLSATLVRYADFFRLFGDFRGYVDFFLLQDLVTEDTLRAKFFMPFAGFTASPLPGTLDAYLAYRHCTIEFIESRNRRIAELAVPS
jgi:hypothetical protein